jgi:hypothetical protein
LVIENPKIFHHGDTETRSLHGENLGIEKENQKQRARALRKDGAKEESPRLLKKQTQGLSAFPASRECFEMTASRVLG